MKTFAYKMLLPFGVLLISYHGWWVLPGTMLVLAFADWATGWRAK